MPVQGITSLLNQPVFSLFFVLTFFSLSVCYWRNKYASKKNVKSLNTLLYINLIECITVNDRNALNLLYDEVNRTADIDVDEVNIHMFRDDLSRTGHGVQVGTTQLNIPHQFHTQNTILTR